MAVQRPCYATREEVKTALDIQETAFDDALVDQSIESASEDADGLCHRRFWIADETQLWDWPNYQYALPWRIWLDERELADTTVTVPVVMSGGILIPSDEIFWGPWNYAPPYTRIELDRSTNAAFGLGDTPQRDVSITGTFGYWIRQAAAGALAAAVASTTATTLTVTDGAAVGVGDMLFADGERMLVQDKQMADTGQSQQTGGAGTDSAADNLLGAGDGSQFSVGEILQLDAEQMLVLSITGNNLTVQRSYNGTVLAEHTGAEIYAMRQLTVTRGDFGIAAATHAQGAALTTLIVPGLVRELALATALSSVLAKTSGYARALPQGAGAVPGSSLPDLRDRCWTRYGRKARQRVI